MGDDHSIDRSKDFNITVGQFTGSLEALLAVVQKRKLHISDISLASVADEYIEYVRSLDELPQGQTAEFIVIASTLLLIKSKSLLPNLELSLEEEESIQDLEDRLKLYKVYQYAKDALEVHLQDANKLHKPSKQLFLDDIHFTPPTDNSLTTNLLHQALINLLNELPQVEVKDRAELTESIDIKDVMQNLLSRVEDSMQTFTSATVGQRQETIVNFLALLELVKDGLIMAEQHSEHGEILIKKHSSVICGYE